MALPVHRSGHRLISCPSGLAPVVGAPILARSAFAPAAFGALIVGIVGDPPVTRPPAGRTTLVVVAGHGRSFPQKGARPRPLNARSDRKDRSAERRAGKECFNTFRSTFTPTFKQNQQQLPQSSIHLFIAINLR